MPKNRAGGGVFGPITAMRKVRMDIERERARREILASYPNRDDEESVDGFAANQEFFLRGEVVPIIRAAAVGEQPAEKALLEEWTHEALMTAYEAALAENVWLLPPPEETAPNSEGDEESEATNS